MNRPPPYSLANTGNLASPVIWKNPLPSAMYVRVLGTPATPVISATVPNGIP